MISPAKERNMKALATYQQKLMRKPKLRYIFFELTDQCNLKCLHCGSRCEPGKSQVLPLETIEKTLQSIAGKCDPKNIMVCLTGGEPLLHPDLERIIQLSHTMGFPVGMTTNGTLIDDRKAESMYHSGLDTVAISIDGTRDVHDRFRCCEGSFERAVNGAGALKRHGIEPQAITVANKTNIHELKALGLFLQAEGFYSWRITNMDPIGRAQENTELLLDRNELFRLLEMIREMRYDPVNEMEVTYGCSHFLTYQYEREVRDFYFQCIAGIQVGSVMANGDIGACLDIERRPDLIQGNIYKDDFMTVWENRFEAFRRNRAEESRVCSGCEYREVCMGDSTHTWNFDLNEPSYCIAIGGL